MTLYVVLVVLVLVVIAKVWLIWYPLLQESRANQLRYLKYLQSVSKKTLDEILLVIDEQLEFLTEDGVDHTSTSIGQEGIAKRRWREYLYLAGSMFLYGLATWATLVPAIAVLPVNSTYVELVAFTNGRKFLMRITRTLGYEVLIADNTTWIPGRAEMYMKDYTSKLRALHENAVTGHGIKNIPATTSIPILNDVLENVGCTYITCDPAVRNYNASIGFSYDEAVAPVNQQITDYIVAAEEFLTYNALKGTKNFWDERMQFMEAMQNDIVEGLLKVDRLVLQQYLPQSNAVASAACIALFVIAVMLFILFYLMIYLAGSFRGGRWRWRRW
ncbi:hypothetical protein M427DRAFT_382143 [Gonapodya prolifera JEL478]|uniref:Uncharacterized protein n=1 Tax=Gonapodya prolifera (strain JEL478) TaxID=1344416 RepID=A0A139A8Z4_GONPJ|nr:hypothetical protein M427DRAFT_382143 [Gonapodya prolifera JEL478]|eukprot:KXS13282.1 hypothetical protein M427DRAFT_382143 [Gonapodya prolifera JEL478]